MEGFLELFVILFLVLLNAFFSLSEMALMSSRRSRLQQRAETGKNGYRVALRTRETPGVFLSTIQVGITLIGILAGAFGGSSIATLITPLLARLPALAPWAGTISFILVVLMTTLLSVVFGELVPKRIALSAPEKIAAFTVIPMRIISIIFAPIVRSLDGLSAFVIRLLRLDRNEEAPITVDELRSVLSQATESGVFGAEEQDMLEGVLDLGSERVTANMTPRTEIEFLEFASSPGKVIDFIGKHPHLQTIPVCKGGLDNPVGILPVHPVLLAVNRHQFHGIRQYLEKPVLIPETLNSLKVLSLLKDSAVKLAFVVDEFGGIKGTVDFTTLAEGILGKIRVTGAALEPEIVRREDGSFLVDGSMDAGDFFKEAGIRDIEPRSDYHTAAGFVLYELGTIPQAGDHFERAGWRFEVVDMDGNRVDKILASPVVAAVANGEQDDSD